MTTLTLIWHDDGNLYWAEQPCPTCNGTEECGEEWDTEDHDGVSTLVPSGRCPTCGGGSQPCSDIEDLYERCEATS